MVITYVPGAAVAAYSEGAPFIGWAIAASGVSALIALGVVWTGTVISRGEKPNPRAG